MILNNSPINQATVSNVEGIGEFRIRNSSKAFSILSSGLYANKIRAIIRELSCNAVDSHTAAGYPDKPFDVHLPTSLNPYFSIRDYGVGLNHQQVSNIYTTYFESTKTESNDFVGALGLGSKSPFSYTDNFTVIAVQNGVKGIYTAFINELGIPNIALMMQENTEDPNGVEVKFAVGDQADFYKFRKEADAVYLHFSVKPNILNTDFYFSKKEYETENIIPGVHSYKHHHPKSIAIMGNIAYPIEIPQAEKVLGKLAYLLSCSLEIHFQIGELDFQASREGLSYIPMTISAIRTKLECLHTILKNKIKTDAENIPNLWDRAVFLSNKRDHPLWKLSTQDYIATAALPTYPSSRFYAPASFRFSDKDLANKWNIQITCLYDTYAGVHRALPENDYLPTGEKHQVIWEIPVKDDCIFFIDDHGRGSIERIKYNYHKKLINKGTSWMLSPADHTKPIDHRGFFAEIFEPPESSRQLISSLEKKPTVKRKNTNVGVLCLIKTGMYNGQSDFSWRHKGKISDLPEKIGDSALVYHYVPLNGYKMISDHGFSDAKELAVLLREHAQFRNIKIHGIRKTDIEAVKGLPDWVNLETHITTMLKELRKQWEPLSYVWSRLNDKSSIWFDSMYTIGSLINKPENIYKKFINDFYTIDKKNENCYNLITLFKRFSIEIPNLDNTVQSYQNAIEEIQKKYPLLAYISKTADPQPIADYINTIDSKKEKK